MKIDICMWTLNAGPDLEKVLMSIERAIPKQYINHKIASDDGSTDDTVKTLKRFGWQVETNNATLGTSKNAQHTLSRTVTEWVGCFEQDIILDPSWFHVAKPFMDRERVGIIYGKRLPQGPIIKAFEQWRYSHTRISLDNALIHKSLLVGIDHKEVVGIDSYLFGLADSLHLKVILLYTRSVHLRGSWRSEIEHLCRAWKRPFSWKRKIRLFGSFVVSPFHAIKIAFLTWNRSMIWFYPYLRLRVFLKC